MKSIRDIAIRLTSTTQAWEGQCPGESFSGLSLEQFKQVTKPSLDRRARLAALEAEWTNEMAGRAAADKETYAVLQRVTHAVKGDPKYGEDSALYQAMGFVPKSQRSTGLTRRREKTPGGPGDGVS